MKTVELLAIALPIDEIKKQKMIPGFLPKISFQSDSAQWVGVQAVRGGIREARRFDGEQTNYLQSIRSLHPALLRQKRSCRTV